MLARALTVLLLWLLAASPAVANEPGLPPRTQALLLLRTLGYDRALPRRAGEVVTVAVAWGAGDEDQRDELTGALRTAAAHVTIAGLHVRVVPVRWERGTLAARLREASADVVILTASLDAEAGAVVRELRESRALSVSGRRGSVEAGISVGLVQRGTRAAVLIHLASARAAGADFDATLFTVAEVVDHTAPARAAADAH